MFEFNNKFEFIYYKLIKKMGCTCSSANQKGSIEIVNNLKKYFSFESMILEGKITKETYENIDFMQR